MKVTVMRLDGTSFHIHVKPDATVEDLKKKIEEDQGSEVYPVCRQILTYGGKFFKNETTLVEYNVTEGSSIVIMGKGIPKQAEPTVSQPSAAGLHANISTPVTKPEVRTSGPNSNPLDLFSQGLPSTSSNADGGSSKALQENPVLQESIQLLQDSPELLLPFLEELARQVPNVPRYIPNHLAEFQRFFREACGEERNSGQLPNAVPPADELTPEEEESIERIVAQVGLDRDVMLDVVLEEFLASNMDEDETALQPVFNQQPEPNAVPVPPAVEFTPEEEESIDRIVAQVGLDRDVVLEEFFASNMDEDETALQPVFNQQPEPNAVPVPPAVELTPEEEESIDRIVAQVGLDRDLVLEEFLEYNKDEDETVMQLLLKYCVTDWPH